MIEVRGNDDFMNGASDMVLSLGIMEWSIFFE